MTLVTFFKNLSNNIDSVMKKMVFLTILGMIVSITLQIIFRVFFNSLTWTEEVARYLLVWSTFIGATLAYKRGLHISVTFIRNMLPEKLRKLICILGIIISIVFFIVVIVFGAKLIILQKTQLSPALRLPMRWVYLVMPFSFIIMIVYGLTETLEQLYGMKGDDVE